MSSNSDFKAAPKSGAAKVYYKNLIKVFEGLKGTDLFFHSSYYQNLLVQAYDCLEKLKKADPDFNSYELENEYNFYKEQYLKQKVKP